MADGTLVLKDRYEVERELGRGGMSAVYLARDRELLSKHVVIKVLLEETHVDPWIRQKFQQEMEALARIDHPGVVGVLDHGLTPDGKQFLVMQYIEGQTLRRALEAGPMDFRRAAGLIRQIGNALAAAHEKGVWHRDLKPENIMLQALSGEEHVKLIDFGIAAIQNSQFGGEKTKVAGSLTYMAPEQFAGHPSAASDTYALGVIAYEMLTGSMAFSPDSMIHLAVEDTTRPARARELRPELPESAERSIRKAMSFNPEMRQADVRQFSEELHQALWGGGPTVDLGERSVRVPTAVASHRSRILPVVGLVLTVVVAAGVLWLLAGGKNFRPARDVPSIAVLPFTDLSPEKNQEYFSEGMAEELLNALAKIPGLRVAARTSSFQFAGMTGDASVIGKKLHVATILEGSVRKQANRVRITTQLIKTADGFHLWSDTYEREMNDIFAVQEEIAGAVTGKLELTLLGKKAVRPRKAPASAAYNAYLQGRYFIERFNRANLEKAAGYFEQAVALDPGYAPAWVGLGESRSNQAMQSYISEDDGFKQARRAAERALQLDPDLAEAHSLMGWIQMFHDWDWSGAETSFQRALALEPGNARMINRAGILARALGRLDDATTLARRSMEVDPLSSGGFHNSGVALYYAGHYDEATAAFRKALELFPERTLSHGYLGLTELVQKHWQGALAEMEQEKNPGLRRFGLAVAYHALGRKKDSDDNLKELIEKDQASYQAAEAYAFRGEADRAFEWLEKTYASHDTGIVQLKGDPLFKSLERDPRYAALLKKARLPL